MFTWPIVLSLVLSSLAFLVALGSLVWQITSWRRSGPRLSVRARSAFAAVGGGLIVIEAKNAGRLATEIQTCGFDLPGGRQIVCLYDFFGQPFGLPAQLPAGGTVDFNYNPRDVLIPFIDEGIVGDGVRAFVQTGHGRIRSDPFHLGRMLKALAPSIENG